MLLATLAALTLQASPCSCPAIVGHRGSGSSTPSTRYAENTVPSVTHAYAVGADHAEVDVHLSADGQVVVHHDTQLGHTTRLQGCITDFTAAELQAADATVGSGAPARAGVPTLAEVLASARQHGRRLNIELKVHGGDASCRPTDVPALVAGTLRAIEESGMASGAYLSSFSLAALEESRRLRPDLEVALLTAARGEVLLAHAQRAAQGGFQALHPDVQALREDPTLLARLQAVGVAVRPWTVNDGESLEALLRSGADGIITDDVAGALALRASVLSACGCPGPNPDAPGTDAEGPAPQEDGPGPGLTLRGCGGGLPGVLALGLLPAALLLLHPRRRRPRP